MQKMTRDNTSEYQRLFLQDVPMIDTRAPVEFQRGAFPHAINLPLMTDEERHLVGTRYKQAGQDSAIQLGRELVTSTLQAERTDQWLEFVENNPEGYLYCFRGGLRSRITQQWIAERGVDYPYVEGGYKAMRRFLIDRFESDLANGNFVLISGRTGVGKTILLNRIQRAIDLEGLANHRGSSFGKMANPQPSQISFENSLAIAMLKLTHADTNRSDSVWIEGEGRQVGSLGLPSALWQKMQESPAVVLEAEMSRRIDIGVQDYVVDLLKRIQEQHPGIDGFDLLVKRHQLSLKKIQKRLGLERYKLACGMLDEAVTAHRDHNDLEGYRPFISFLLAYYYDPMYDYQFKKLNAKILCRGDEEELLQYLRSNEIGLLD